MSYRELAIHDIEEDLVKNQTEMASVFERNKTIYYLIKKNYVFTNLHVYEFMNINELLYLRY